MDNEQYKADMDAIRHELEAVWEAINELQGIDPANAGKPHTPKLHKDDKEKKVGDTYG